MLSEILSFVNIEIHSPPACQEQARPAAMDERVFQAFYQRTARPLWAYVYRICGDPSLSDDIVQDAYCRFLQAHIDSDDFPRLRAYLYRIATNLATDHWRRVKNPCLEDSGEAAEHSVDDAGERIILRTDLERAMALLKPRERALLWLAYGQGADHAEIARCLGIKRASVKVLLFRARRKIARILKRRGLDRDSDPIGGASG